MEANIYIVTYYNMLAVKHVSLTNSVMVKMSFDIPPAQPLPCLISL